MVREKTATITWKTDATAKNCRVEIHKKNSSKIIVKEGTLTLHENNRFNEVVFEKLKPTILTTINKMKNLFL